MKTTLLSAMALLSSLFLAPASARAHCDALDGPLVKVGLGSLESGRIEPVLAWVEAKREGEIRGAFEHARSVRKLGPQAKELADRYFLETLVRVHRDGEGAPYTGLKPAGTTDPAVVAADKSLERKDLKPIQKHVQAMVQRGLEERFARATAPKAPATDVEAGRRQVQAYIDYVHYVEALHKVAGAASHGSEASHHSEASGGSDAAQEVGSSGKAGLASQPASAATGGCGAHGPQHRK